MQINHSNLSFKAGLSKHMQREIAEADVKKISQEFIHKGIETNFKENKILAWCSLQCLKIIDIMNKKYGLKLGLPNGIFVEDFKELNVQDKNATGFLNFAPAKLYLGKDKITPEKTIFFNEFEEFNYSRGNEFWDKIDRIADENFDRHFSSTDFFLEPILHEFLHATHEENLIQKLSGKKLVKLLEETLTPSKLETFSAKYARMLEKICTYAAETPFEAVACDLSKRTIENIDKTTLLPQSNFISNSPYHKLSLLKRLFVYESESTLARTLRHFWEGKMG